MRSRPLCLCLHVDFAPVLHNKCQDKRDMHSKMSTKTTKTNYDWLLNGVHIEVCNALDPPSQRIVRSFIFLLFTATFSLTFHVFEAHFFFSHCKYYFRFVGSSYDSVFDKVNTMAFYQVHCVWFAAKCKEEMQPNSSRLYNTHPQDAMIYLLFSYLLTFQCYCKNILAS